MGKVLTVCDLVEPEQLATQIAQKYDHWKMARAKKEASWQEVRNYVFATDTSTTSNSKLPWKNRTTRPKVCQIRDNLHANYMAALFPNDDWFDWIPADQNAADADKAQAIRIYIKNKLRQCKFEQTVSKYVYDFIDYGNVFGDAEYVHESFKDSTGQIVDSYVGPRPVRISPYDVVLDITAASFEQAPKITRSLISFGEIAKLKRSNPDWAAVDPAKLKRISDNRIQAMAYRPSDIKKSDGLVADGFSSLYHYYSSGLVEVLEFEGDLYDTHTGTLKENRIITVIDRAYVIRDEPIKSWTGTSTKLHCGWRLRPDNLMAMGPLDNLVGMQYRIDHLENLKADVFDLIAYPVFKIKGYVEDFEYGPNERIYMEESADVEFMRPETTALNADMQIRELEEQMEDMAGAPRTAMGIRTPGEKTKFEVQTLDNAAGRVFQSKIGYFERHFLEPLLNNMLELARRNIDTQELVQTLDDDIGVAKFLTVTKQDLQARGRLQPIGARHFAAQAQLIQNLTQLSATPIFQDQNVRVHFSGLKLAKLLEENMGLTQYRIVEPNIAIIENAETQQLAASASEQVQAGAQTPVMTPEDIPDAQEEDDQSGP